MNIIDALFQTYEKLAGHHLGDKPTPIIESNCELVHPRPKAYFVLTQQQVAGMEEQALTMAKERRRELRTLAKAEFERSDDDEIVSTSCYHHDISLTVNRLFFPSVATLAGLLDTTGPLP